MDQLPNTERLAKEMAQFCQQVMTSVTNSVLPVLMVVAVALTVSGNLPDKGQGFWSRF